MLEGHLGDGDVTGHTGGAQLGAQLPVVVAARRGLRGRGIRGRVRRRRGGRGRGGRVGLRCDVGGGGDLLGAHCWFLLVHAFRRVLCPPSVDGGMLLVRPVAGGHARLRGVRVHVEHGDLVHAHTGGELGARGRVAQGPHDPHVTVLVRAGAVLHHGPQLPGRGLRPHGRTNVVQVDDQVPVTALLAHERGLPRTGRATHQTNRHDAAFRICLSACSVRFTDRSMNVRR